MAAEMAGTAAPAQMSAIFPEDTMDYEVVQSFLAVHRKLEAELPKGRIAIYEAGGGSTTYMPPSLLARSDVTVVDIDPNQVARCDYATSKRVGDIQTYRFDSPRFDLVVCFNVIEHLTDVEGALRGFAESLRPGGIIFIGAPNPRSLSGVVTRYTPHWFHVWFYRHILQDRNAGKPGYPPFPTVFHPLVSINRLRAFMNDLGFETILEKVYESERYPSMRRRRPAIGFMLDATATVLNGLTVNSVDVRRGDYHVLYRKL